MRPRIAVAWDKFNELEHGLIDRFDVEGYPLTLSGEVYDEDEDDYVDVKIEVTTDAELMQFVLIASGQVNVVVFEVQDNGYPIVVGSSIDDNPFRGVDYPAVCFELARQVITNNPTDAHT